MARKSNKNSLVSIRGEALGPDHNGYLRLRNEQGLFKIKMVSTLIVPEPGSQVQVVGTLHSFVFSRCHRHHLYIKAETVTPVGETGDTLSLVLPWLMQT